MAAEQPSVARVRQLYDALSARDLEAFSQMLAPEVDWQTPGVVPWGGTLRGVVAVRGYVTDMWGFFEEYSMSAQSFAGRAELVVVDGCHRGLRGAGTLHEIPFSDLCTVEDDLVTSWRQQVDAGLIMRAICDELRDARLT